MKIGLRPDLCRNLRQNESNRSAYTFVSLWNELSTNKTWQFPLVAICHCRVVVMEVTGVWRGNTSEIHAMTTADISTVSKSVRKLNFIRGGSKFTY